MILLELAAAVLLLLGSALILRAVIAADAPSWRERRAGREPVAPPYRKAA